MVGWHFWEPITCPNMPDEPGCKIEITGSETLVGWVRLCAFHATQTEIGEPLLFAAVKAKCREVEKARHLAAEVLGVPRPDEPTHFVLPDWYIDQLNILHIILPADVKEVQKQEFKDALALEFGAGKIIVQIATAEIIVE